MVWCSLGVYNTILNEYCNPLWSWSTSRCHVQTYHKLAQIRYENPIHKVHKSHIGIGQAKGPHCKFTMTISGPNYDFGDVRSLNFKLMISKPQMDKTLIVCS